MKAIFAALVISVFAAAASRVSVAEEPKKEAPKKDAPAPAAAAKGAEVTLKGTMMCAKCVLKEQGNCQNVLKVGAGAKEVKYYMAKNAVAEDHHEEICGRTAKATVKGTVSEEGGKKILTASDIKIESGK
jgi:hypothetical protein